MEATSWDMAERSYASIIYSIDKGELVWHEFVKLEGQQHCTMETDYDYSMCVQFSSDGSSDILKAAYDLHGDKLRGWEVDDISAVGRLQLTLMTAHLWNLLAPTFVPGD